MSGNFFSLGIRESDPPRMFSPEASSLYRRIRDIVGVICMIWRSVQSYFITIQGMLPTLPDGATKDLAVGNTQICAITLQSGAPLNTTSVLAYSDMLQDGSQLQVCKDYFTSPHQVNHPLPQWEQDETEELRKTMLAFPIVVEGAFRNHMLTVFVDSTLHTIEFYDPKGLTIADRAGDSLVHAGGTLGELMERIWAEYAKNSEWTLCENMT